MTDSGSKELINYIINYSTDLMIMDLQICKVIIVHYFKLLLQHPPQRTSAAVSFSKPRLLAFILSLSQTYRITRTTDSVFTIYSL